MRRASSCWSWMCAGALLAAPPAIASADRATAEVQSKAQRHEDARARIKLDASGRPAYLSRFSDGPRRVPKPRGAAKRVAERLGIGSTDVARKLLRSGPSRALRQAVPGRAPRTLLWPVVHGRFGRGFGFTRRARPELRHNGVDIGAPEGTVVRAAAAGLVVYSDNKLVGYGNCVIILHAKGTLTLYAHNERTTVQAGWFVRRGERIGLVGTTGYAWGPHLHFELRQNGRLRDPMPLFRGRGSDEVTGPLVDLRQPGPAAGRVAPRPTARAKGVRARTLPLTAATAARGTATLSRPTHAG